MGIPTIYVRNVVRDKIKTVHIFMQEIDESWVAICDRRIVYKHVRAGRLREVNCQRCQQFYNPGLHLHY